jgi:hypothetical protein
MRVPELAYLFIYFALLHPNGKELTLKKTEPKGLEYRDKILSDITELAKKAMASLNEMSA